MHRVRARVGAEQGFTLIEVMVAAFVLVVGLGALLGMFAVASKTTQTNRVRQEATNVAREVVENVRALSYTQLATPSSIATALLPQLTPGATRSGSTLTVTRSPGTGGAGANGYAFNVTFTTCSMDDPSDGYGNHSLPPASGGSWCPDVAPSGTADPNPDDYKRVSIIVTPTGNGGEAVVYPVQQTVDIYAKVVNGPAVSCLTVVGGPCPGQNQSVTTLGTMSMTFNVTTTSLPQKIQWLVNGNPPGAQDPSGANGTYTPTGTTSSFTWDIPTTTVGGTTYTIDGSYLISAVGFDANGNSGTKSTLQVTVNEHPVLAPAASSFVVGFDRQINSGTGGVDIQWVPSVDQDVLYYNVYHQVSVGGVTTTTQVCSGVTGTSCTDTSALTIGAAPIWPVATTCTGNPPQRYTTTNLYWVVGVDRYPSGALRDPNTGTPGATAFQTPPVDANVCDHPPNPPTNLVGAVSGGALNLSWAMPTAPVDPDAASDGDTISSWRLYRWPATQGATPQLTAANRLQLIGASSGSGWVTTASDPGADPGGVSQDYCVTAVDTHLNESACSNVVTQ